MRVGIIALLQESNTFLGGVTTLAHFAQDLLCEGEEVRRRLEGTHHEVGGFFAGLAEAGIEAVPIFAARALPYGVMTAECFETLLLRMDAALAAAGPLDGLLVAPHGATVADGIPDADGCWLELLRGRVGDAVPIIGTLDLHANLSPRMVGACDALVAYRTNPHLDQRIRGQEAAALMARTLRGELRPVMAAVFLPLLINIERQASAEHVCAQVYVRAALHGQRHDAVSNSAILGFPYADVPNLGASLVTVTNRAPAGARALAAELAAAWWHHRRAFRGQLVSVDEAVARTAALDGPVGLLDMGDNVGGGAPGSSTILVHALHRARVMPAFACLHDPVTCYEVAAADVGSRLRLRVGGHQTDPDLGKPFEADFWVRGVYDGRFEEPEARHGGFRTFDQGPTRVLETDDGLTLMATDRRMAAFSLRQLTAFGIDPTRFRALVVKGVHAPVAAYAPVCKHLIRVNTPGVTTADLSRLTYRQRRRPMYPFEPDMHWEPTDVVMGHQLARG